jgi:hypothetical protein
MAWHTPKTWTTLYAVTAADFNLEIKDLFNTLWVGTTAGDLDYYTSSTVKSRLGIGTARQMLATNSGATAPEWQNSPQSLMTATGDLLYASSANTPAKLAIGTAGQFLKYNGGLPSWQAVVGNRQGGAADNWDTPGHTNYVPTAVKIQCGSHTASIGTASVSFCAAFSYAPIVFLTPLGFGGNIAQLGSTAASGFDYEVYHHDGTQLGDITIYWLAIGPE